MFNAFDKHREQMQTFIDKVEDRFDRLKGVPAIEDGLTRNSKLRGSRMELAPIMASPMGAGMIDKQASTELLIKVE